jgi:serine/threonine protein kinase
MATNQPEEQSPNIRRLLDALVETEQAERERKALRRLLTPAQFAECLNVFKTSRLGGLDTSIADIAVRRGYVTQAVLDAGIQAVQRAETAPLDTPEEIQALVKEAGAEPAEPAPEPQQARPPRAGGRADREDLSGTRFGSFELLRIHGRGPLGDTYFARRQNFTEPVAVKVYPVASVETVGLPNLLFDRMKKAGAIKHPCLAAALGCGRSPDGRFLYFASNFIQGENLASLLQRRTRLDDTTALAIIAAAARGLAEGHQRGIVHGNLKPSNILVTPDGEVHVTDLGMPRSSQFAVTECQQGNGADLRVDEVAFIPPELVEGQNLLPSADTYSLGLLLAFLLSGHVPFDGEPPEILDAVAGEANPLAVLTDIPVREESRLVLETMVTRVPGWRYEDMNELNSALKGALDAIAGRTTAFKPRRAPRVQPEAAPAPEPAESQHGLISPESMPEETQSPEVPAEPRLKTAGGKEVPAGEKGASTAFVALIEESTSSEFNWQSGTFPGLGSAIFRSSPNLLAVSSESLVGHVLGPWKLTRLLGHGVVGDTYLAERTDDRRLAAVKIFLPQILNTEAAVRRFNSRCRAAVRIQHPNLLKGYDYGQSEEGICYFAMEFVKARPLKKLIRRNGMIPEKMALAVALFIARGLQHAHDRGIIHGNLKPANVLVNRQGYVKCSDTGLPRSSEIVVDESLASDLPGELSPAAVSFVCPEIVQGLGDLRPAADVYGLGMLLFHMLTGRNPFRGTVHEILERIRRAETPRFVSSDDNASEPARVLVRHMIEPGLPARVPSMDVVITELRNILDALKSSTDVTGMGPFSEDTPSKEGIQLPDA